jgi:hypothetical protein
VSGEITVPVPVMSGEAGFRLQLAGLVAPLGAVTVHVRATTPVNPLDGLMMIAEVLPAMISGLMLRLFGIAVRVNPGGGRTVTVTLAV